MLTDSDHFSVRLNLTMTKQTRPTLTARQTMNKRQLHTHFSSTNNHQTVTLLTDDIETKYKVPQDENGNEYNKLMTAVQSVLQNIPPAKRKKAGWCDTNQHQLQSSIHERDAACLIFAQTKTEEAKVHLHNVRSILKKKKQKAKNDWILQQLGQCNESVLPALGDRKNPYAIWKLATKLNNGLDKWRTWSVSNVKGKDGSMTHTPQENAEVFQNFFNDLFSNDSPSLNSQHEYSLMDKIPVDREWGPPTMWEMEKALTKMKHTAAGISGIPASVWQACGSNNTLKTSMLKVMIDCWETEEVPQQ
jgi:hypothetical protein